MQNRLFLFITFFVPCSIILFAQDTILNIYRIPQCINSTFDFDKIEGTGYYRYGYSDKDSVYKNTFVYLSQEIKHYEIDSILFFVSEKNPCKLKINKNTILLKNKYYDLLGMNLYALKLEREVYLIFELTPSASGISINKKTFIILKRDNSSYAYISELSIWFGGIYNFGDFDGNGELDFLEMQIVSPAIRDNYCFRLSYSDSIINRGYLLIEYIGMGKAIVIKNTLTVKEKKCY